MGGNWKMHNTIPQAISLASQLKEELKCIEDVEIVIFPPFTALFVVKEVIRGSNLKLGAQNMHWEDKGAFTGEVSPLMIKDIGCEYVILGHSERRRGEPKETHELVNRKVKSALRHGLIPIVCLGESSEERENGLTEKIVTEQLKGSLTGLQPEDVQKIIIAYEPVWAIGTGETATPVEANRVQALLREEIALIWGRETAQNIRIQYGGSITSENISQLIAQPNIDGGLVGGASLLADSFVKIVKACSGTKGQEIFR